MKGNITNLILLAVLVPSLAACQVFQPRHHARIGAAAPVLPKDIGEGYLADGRKALDRGEITAAVTAFRNAKLYPGHEAAAFNGLAIAYSRLGRTDLTERFFLEAVALAPDESRFRMNLARFYAQHPAVPLQVLGAISPVPLPGAGAGTDLAARTRAQSASARIRINDHVATEAPRSRLVRVSANEVRLDSASAGPDKAGVRNTSAYPVRIGFSTGSAAAKVIAYPIQIRLAD
jgi:tetratricopeptide (TPR) repeat protein